MKDNIWFIISAILLIFLSSVFFILGWQIYRKQRIDLIISYHHDKVSEKDRLAYCRLTGIALLIIGLGFGLSGICVLILQSSYSFIPMLLGLVSGIILLIISGIRFNHQ